MKEVYIETDKDQNVVFAVVPPCIAMRTLDKKYMNYDHLVKCVFEAR
jgi:hypothetical protein